MSKMATLPAIELVPQDAHYVTAGTCNTELKVGDTPCQCGKVIWRRKTGWTMALGSARPVRPTYRARPH